jgi:lysophospholipase L1-like esterase
MEINMKKTLSVVLAAAMCISAAPLSVSNAEDSTKNLVVLGDSISTGYNLVDGTATHVEYNYADICADYLGWNLSNNAVTGDTTSDLYSKLQDESSAAFTSTKDADVVVISIGGGDILQYIGQYICNYAATKELLIDGVTSDDIPDRISMLDILDYVDKHKLFENLNSSAYAASDFISQLRLELINTTADPNGYIQTDIVPNTQKIIERIHEINSDAEVVLQTVYQPLQLSQEVWNASFATGMPYGTYGIAVNTFRLNFTEIMNSYQTSILALTDDYSYLKIADVYSEFTSLSSAPTRANQGHAYYFTNIEGAADDTGLIAPSNLLLDSDVHPNQKGHLAIAAAVLEQIGELHNTSSNTLLRKIHDSLDDVSEYPEIAAETYTLVAGDLVEDKNENATGDVDENGVVDNVDSTFVLIEYTLTSTGQDGTFTDVQKKAADVNNDGKVDNVDSTFILSYYTYIATGGNGTFEDYMNK